MIPLDDEESELLLLSFLVITFFLWIFGTGGKLCWRVGAGGGIIKSGTLLDFDSMSSSPDEVSSSDKIHHKNLYFHQLN